MIDSILSFLKGFKVLNVKVVRNDTLEFGTERVIVDQYLGLQSQ